MDPLEKQIRDENPDWSDEQVAEELERRKAPEPDDPPDPADPPKPSGRDDAFARMRRDLEAAKKREAKAKEKLAEKEREEAEKAGEWKKLAEQFERERDELKVELAKLRFRIKAERAARRRKFRNTDEAIDLLPEGVDSEDDAALDEALEVLAENRPHLIDNGAAPPSGAPAGGGSPPALTREQIAQMSPEEVNRRWDEVQKVLAQN